MSSAGALRKLPSLIVAQYAHRTSAGVLVGSSARLLFTGVKEQQHASNEKERNPIAAAAAVLGFGVAATASGLIGASAADAPKPIEVVPDPYARTEQARPLPSRITLYQYEVCPYCCKVRAFLDYYQLPYTVIEVNPLTKGELKWSNYKKVPIVLLDEEVVADSSAIMSRLATDVAAARPQASAAAPAGPEPAPASPQQQPAEAAPKRSGWSFFGSSKSKSGDVGSGVKDQAPVAAPAPVPVSETAGTVAADVAEEVRWRKWVDEKLVKVLTANIYRNWDESVETFKYISDQSGWSWGARELARWAGAVMMWQVGKRMPAKYGIEGDLRVALYDTANDFADNALRGRCFAGGDQPNLADLAAFGVIRAVRQTGAFRDLMANSRLAPWFAAMEEVVGPSARITTTTTAA